MTSGPKGMKETLEETVRRIFADVCNQEKRDSQASSITGERIQPFERFSRRNLRFARAQKLLVQELRSASANQQRLKSAIKEARRNRNKDAAVSLSRELNRVEFKERLFRSLADCIAWQLIGGRIDIARHLDISEPTRPNPDSSNMNSIAATAHELNQQNALSFALVSDLTSFVQIGDLLRRDICNPNVSVIEVKEGQKNIQAFEILEREGSNNLDFYQIGLSHGQKLMKQVRRIQRQKLTADQALHIINTGSGKDPVSGLPVWIPEPLHRPSRYDYLLAKALTELDERMWSFTGVENAVLLGCYTGKMKRVGHTALHLVAEQTFKQNFVLVNFGAGSLTPLAEPIFMKPFREKDIFDIVFDRTRVYIAIGLDVILEMFKMRGFNARWLSKRETARLQAGPEEVKPHRNRNYRLFTSMEKALAVSNDEYEMFLGDGLITRIAYENILPSAVVGMFSQSLEQANVKDL